jgi:hypothetical protein
MQTRAHYICIGADLYGLGAIYTGTIRELLLMHHRPHCVDSALPEGYLPGQYYRITTFSSRQAVSSSLTKNPQGQEDISMALMWQTILPK